MLTNVFYEFAGTFAVLYANARFGNLFVVVVAFILAKLITSGHLNPALTFWHYLSSNVDGSTAIMYVLSQLSAAFFTYYLYK